MKQLADKSVLAVVGPTACGKTRRSVELARHFNGEIISGDSRQVYRGMNIGTGKDIEEYGDVPAHLLDIMPAGTKYNLHRFLSDFNAARQLIYQRGRLPILCGGTGMYIEAALNGLQLPEVPENAALRQSLQNKSLAELTAILSKMKRLHNSTDVDTEKRAIRAIEIEQYYLDNPDKAVATKIGETQKPDSVIIGLDIPRELRRKRISERLQVRLEQGMVAEIENLLNSGVKADDLIYYGLEYKFVTQHVLGLLSYDEMFTQLETAIHQFAKRQMTWFRGMERRGFKINWVPYDIPTDQLIQTTESLLKTAVNKE